MKPPHCPSRVVENIMDKSKYLRYSQRHIRTRYRQISRQQLFADATPKIYAQTGEPCNVSRPRKQLYLGICGAPHLVPGNPGLLPSKAKEPDALTSFLVTQTAPPPAPPPAPH